MENLIEEKPHLQPVRKDGDALQCCNAKGLATLEKFDHLYQKFSELETLFQTQSQAYEAKFEEYEDKWTDQNIINEDAFKARKR